ncbi:MAG: putative baseplate assembly protein, partial [Chloroflexi bacterium]|nr:putative baseplate assembly protein [Chloroflexota bacterium]
MPLPSPNLDDRTFQDLVREARSMIPRYCPEWTDHNLSDPGITLIELFAWMTDTLLYRMNKVPDKNYIKFMELLGIRLAPPKPAKVDITFRLSAAQPGPVTIPTGTEVATVRTETQEAIIFTTDRDLVIAPPIPSFAFTSPDGIKFEDVIPALKNPDRLVTVFDPVPREGNAFYLGYAENLKSQALTLNFTCRSEGIGIDPTDPPWAWEFWDGENERWGALKLEKDSTGGLNATGQVTLHVPETCVMNEVNGQRACWIRCRATKARPDQRPYTASPRVANIGATCMGGTVPASHAMRTKAEFLGRSNGNPGQKFTLRNPPLLTRQPGETI